MQIIGRVRSVASETLVRLNIVVQIVIVVLACLIVGGLIFWLCNELVYYFVARGYAEELAEAYDLNPGVAKAVLWASFAAIVVLAGYSLSLSKQKRRIGYVGLLSLLIGHSLLLGRIDANFRKNGVAAKCYVMMRTSIKTLNRAGIDPETGRECRPLTPQIVEKIEEYRRGHRPTQITSSDPIFFDLTTGEPVVWYSKNDRGQIQLFDLMGFQPQTGEELVPVTREVVNAWEQQNAKVVRRVPVRVLEPEKYGFFDPTTGSAKIWYWRSGSGEYEFYDGPGFHQRSGDQLTIVTQEVLSDWRQQQETLAARKKAEDNEARERAEREAQQAREAAEREQQAREAAAAKVVRRVPVRVMEPEKYGFFDPTTGAAKVWYWRSRSGEYEFYDGPGFHQRSGDQLIIVTQEVISGWRQQQEALAARKKAEDEQRNKEARERAEREAQQAREAAEREQQAREAAAEELRRRQQSGNDCDRLAANPTDIRRVGQGVPFDVLKHQADQAYEACTEAVATFPAELRYQYQLGRAAQYRDKKQAFEIFSQLVQANYPAAFDNLGGMYRDDKKDVATAITLFERGRALDDADSMVSLVDLIDKGVVPTPNPEQTKLALLHRAAQLGHSGAQRGYELEQQKADQARINQINQQQMMRVFGAFIQGVARR